MEPREADHWMIPRVRTRMERLRKSGRPHSTARAPATARIELSRPARGPVCYDLRMGGSGFDFVHYLADGGLLSWLAILVALGLFVAGGVLMVAARTRRAFVPFLIAAFLPLLIGAGGMAVGNMLVDRVAKDDPGVTAADVDAGRRQARIALEIGACASAPIVLLGLIGLLVKAPGGWDRDPARSE